MKDETKELMEDVLVNSLVQVNETENVKDKAVLLKEVTAFTTAMNAAREMELKAEDSKARNDLDEKKIDNDFKIEKAKLSPWLKVAATTVGSLVLITVNAVFTNAFNVQGYTFEKDNYISSMTFKKVVNAFSKGFKNPFMNV